MPIPTAKQLFLIDGIGAMISAFFLGFVLVRFEQNIGIPSNSLYSLALIPFAFSIYDFICFKYLTKQFGKYLILIAIANLIYCCYSLYILNLHSRDLSILANVYFALEISIILVLVVLELKTALKC